MYSDCIVGGSIGGKDRVRDEILRTLFFVNHFSLTVFSLSGLHSARFLHCDSGAGQT